MAMGDFLTVALLEIQHGLPVALEAVTFDGLQAGQAISNEMQQNREPLKSAMKDSIPAALVQSRELHRKTPHPRVRLHRFR